MTILTKIIEQKKRELSGLKANPPEFPTIQKQRPSLYETLMHTNHLQVIAEMKRASPSKGDIATHIDPVEQATQYAAAGAACISVLTEQAFFKGSFKDLNDVAQHVDVAILCKDFIIDEVQLDYAKAAGASVALLIVAALTEQQLQTLHQYAEKIGLEVLVEVHDIEELQIALRIGAKIIGVNNRNLKTFEVDLAHTEQIAQHFSNMSVAFISESGIWTREDAVRVAKAGAKAVLVGESLMRSDDVKAALQSFQVDLLVEAGDVK